MKSIKKLANALFGTRKEYEVKGLGVFHSKVCSWWPDGQYPWWLTVRLPSYPAETAIWLDGDISAPLPRQVSGLQALLENWESVVARVGSLLPNESRLAHKEELYASWQDRFYPEAIEPSTKYGDGWEITFTTENLDCSFCFVWKNNAVRDLSLDY